MKKDKKKIMEKISIHNKNIIAETVYDYDTYKSIYIVKNLQDNKISEENGVEINNTTYKPFSKDSELLNKNILTLATGLEDYKNKEELIKEIKEFIHSYVDVSESFEIVATYYTLMTWIYDIFDNVGYLRVRANPGNGKSRFLDVMNAISYKSTFFRVNPTEAVLFRALDDTRGTMLIDEADYNNTNKTSGLIKMLNNGFAKNSSITRNKARKDGGYELESFSIFSPKIIANRDFFQDDALESRCFTEYMNKSNIREEVLVKLDSNFEEKSMVLRNKLLKFRMNNLNKIKPLNSNEIKMNITSRSKQIAIPIATLMEKVDLKHLEKVILNTQNNLKTMRSDLFESDIIKFLKAKMEEKKTIVSIKEIADYINENSESWDKISNRKIGSILTNLHIKKSRGGKQGNFIVSVIENRYQIENLSQYYNI